jgi:hypothetical protein
MKYPITILVLGLLARPLAAQEVFGTIRGAAAPGTPVTLENTSFATTADASGRYEIRLVPAGEYRLCAASSCTAVHVRAGNVALAGLAIGGDDLRRTSTDDPRQALVRSAGVAMRSGAIGIVNDVGLSIRGGEAGHEAAYVDGAPVRFQTLGTHRLVPGANGLDEIAVTTGMAGATVRDVANGVVGYTTRIAPSSRVAGLRFESDEPFGTLGVGYNRLSAELGGSLPALRRLATFFSASLQGQRYGYRGIGAGDEPVYRIDGIDTIVQRSASGPGPVDTIPLFARESGLRPQYDWTSRRVLQGRALYTFGAGASLSITGLTNDFEQRSDPVQNLMAPSLYEGMRSWSRLLAVNWGQPLGRTLALEVNASLSGDHEISGPLTAASEMATRDPAFGFASHTLEFRGPDSFAINQQVIVRMRNGASPTVPYQNRFDLSNTHPTRANPYGVSGRWTASGLDAHLHLADETRKSARALLHWRPRAAHDVSLGFDADQADITLYDANLLQQVGLDAFIESPGRTGFFAADHFTWGSITVDAGLRYDIFAPGGQFPKVPGRIYTSPAGWNPDTVATDTAYTNSVARIFTPGRSQGILSPELRLTHDITPRSEVRVSVSRRARAPEYADLFAGTSADLAVSFPSDPRGSDVDIASTTTVEAGLRHVFSDHVRVDVSGYGLNAATYGQHFTQIFDPFRNEVENISILTKIPSRDGLGADLRVGVRSGGIGATAAYSFLSLSPPGGQEKIASHVIHALVDVRLPLAIDARVTGRFANGAAYTSLANAGAGIIAPYEDPFFALNASIRKRLPWTKTVDLRLSREFAVGTRSLSVFADARNVLNFRNLFALFAETGSARNDAFQSTWISPQLAILAGEAPAGAQAGGGTIDLTKPCSAWNNVTNCVSLQRVEQRFGNGDGMFTTAEQTAAFTAEYESYFGPSRFAEPGRTIRIGVEIR